MNFILSKFSNQKEDEEWKAVESYLFPKPEKVDSTTQTPEDWNDIDNTKNKQKMTEEFLNVLWKYDNHSRPKWKSMHC